mmetsp:Transcript_25635/g.64610  ORF Transcript_25635/g.64610 Transcript_25635/m.64610 type:complete len:331 (+) Transcript_25635:940-1932(+)
MHRLAHASIEERAEMFAPGCKVAPRGVHRHVFDEEGDVPEDAVVHYRAEVFDQVARRDGHRFEFELVEVVEHRGPVVAAEDVEAVAAHRAHEARAARRRVLGVYREPGVDVEAELEQVVQPVVARVAPKHEQRVVVHHGGVEVARRGHVPARTNRRPSARGHAELVKVVQPVHTVVPAEEIEGVLMRRPGWAAPPGGYAPFLFRLYPPLAFPIHRTRQQREFRHVVQPRRPVVAAEDEDGLVVVLRGDVAETQARHAALTPTGHALPHLRLEVETPKVVQPRKTGIPAENIHFPPDDERSVVFSRHGFFVASWVYLLPFSFFQVESPEVV